MALVFVDLDGTITKTDTFVLYCLFALLSRPWRLLLLGRIVKEYARFIRGKCEVKELKESFISTFLGGSSIHQAAGWNKLFIALVIPFITRKEMMKTIWRHQQKGDVIYIVSASPDVPLKALVKLWKLDGLISTTLEWKNGKITGKIVGENCSGEEKARRIKELFSESDLRGSFAYGNAESDRHMLETVSFGNYVGRRARQALS